MKHPTGRWIYLLLVTVSAVAMGVLFWLFLDQRASLQRQILANTANYRAAAIAAYQADRALCLRKEATMRSLQDSLQYLHEHPRGTADIPRVLIAHAIRDDRAAIKALSDVRCPPAKPKGLP